MKKSKSGFFVVWLGNPKKVLLNCSRQQRSILSKLCLSKRHSFHTLSAIESGSTNVKVSWWVNYVFHPRNSTWAQLSVRVSCFCLATTMQGCRCVIQLCSVQPCVNGATINSACLFLKLILGHNSLCLLVSFETQNVLFRGWKKPIVLPRSLEVVIRHHERKQLCWKLSQIGNEPSNQLEFLHSQGQNKSSTKNTDITVICTKQLWLPSANGLNDYCKVSEKLYHHWW